MVYGGYNMICIYIYTYICIYIYTCNYSILGVSKARKRKITGKPTAARDQGTLSSYLLLGLAEKFGTQGAGLEPQMEDTANGE